MQDASEGITDSGAGGDVAFAPDFKMGLIEMIAWGAKKDLWVANCFSLIRTWGAFSCLRQGCKVFSLLEGL